MKEVWKIKRSLVAQEFRLLQLFGITTKMALMMWKEKHWAVH